ncbi:MAG: prolipoprotein diacylglyceryl transferase family protein, partial [Rhizobium rhizophilum]
MLSVLDLFAAVSFPAIDPVAFSIGPLAVHWYGLAYVAVFLIGWIIARYLLKRPHIWPNGQAPATL